jgi:hypothetical protein
MKLKPRFRVYKTADRGFTLGRNIYFKDTPSQVTIGVYLVLASSIEEFFAHIEKVYARAGLHSDLGIK